MRMAELAPNVRSIYTDMPPCRKICTGQWMPVPLPNPATSTAPASPVIPQCPALPPCPAPPAGPGQPLRPTLASCPAVPGSPVLPACPALPACLAPSQLFSLECSCDEPELTCDDDTCANAADCMRLLPEICPHGLATDDDRKPPANPELIHLTCPHCLSQIALFDDKKPQPPINYPMARINQTQPGNSILAQKNTTDRTASSEISNRCEYCLPNCPSKKFLEIKPQPCHSPLKPVSAVPSYCGSNVCDQSSLEQPDTKNPRANQIQVATSDDQLIKSCCKSANAPKEIRTLPTCCETGGNVRPVTKTQVETCQPPPARREVCLQAAATPATTPCQVSAAGRVDQGSQARSRRDSLPNQRNQNEASSARGGSSKNNDQQSPDSCANPDCQRSGETPLFPAKPAPRACLCRMPPAYAGTGCTGNLSGNCNCSAVNK